MVVEATNELIRRESTVAAFCSRRLARSANPRDLLKLSDVSKAFVTFCSRKKLKPVRLKDMKVQLTGHLGEIVTSSNNGVRNYWPGWTLLVAPPVGEESDDELEDDLGPEG